MNCVKTRPSIRRGDIKLEHKVQRETKANCGLLVYSDLFACLWGNSWGSPWVSYTIQGQQTGLLWNKDNHIDWAIFCDVQLIDIIGSSP